MDTSITQAHDWASIAALLAAPFDSECVQFKPQTKAGEDGLAVVVAFIDARDVQDRLDAVVGPGGWEFAVEPLHINAKGQVDVARGTITIHGVSKSDIGDAGESGVEPSKSSASDAEKRAGVQWGVARYLYALPLMKCKLTNGKYISAADLRTLRAKLPKPGKSAPRTGPYQDESMIAEVTKETIIQVIEEAQNRLMPGKNAQPSIPQERIDSIEANAWEQLQKRAETLGFDEEQFSQARKHYQTVAAVAAALDRVAAERTPKPSKPKEADPQEMAAWEQLHIRASHVMSVAAWDDIVTRSKGDITFALNYVKAAEAPDLSRVPASAKGRN